MSEEEKAKIRLETFKLCVIRNSISLFCFTLLAITFQKWWIVFFSILFYMWVTDDKEK